MDEPVKKKSRFVNLGRTRGIIDVCTTTSDSDEPAPPKPKVRKPRKTKKKKVVYRPPADSDSSDDFADDDSGNEWRPVKRDRTIRSKVPKPITEMIAMHLSRKKRERAMLDSSAAADPVPIIPPQLSNQNQDKPTHKSDRDARVFEKLNDLAKELKSAESEDSRLKQGKESDKPCSPEELMELIEKHSLYDVQLYSDESSNENNEYEKTRNTADEVLALTNADFEISPITKLALSCIQLYVGGKLVEGAENPVEEFEKWLEGGPRILRRQNDDGNIKHMLDGDVEGKGLYSGLIADSFPLTYVMFTESERLPQGTLLNPLNCNFIERLTNSSDGSSRLCCEEAATSCVNKKIIGLPDDQGAGMVSHDRRLSHGVAAMTSSPSMLPRGNLWVTHDKGSLNGEAGVAAMTSSLSSAKSNVLNNGRNLPFKCVQCDYTTAQKSCLKCHMITRHGSKADLPFKCSLCDYASAQNSNLKTHMMSKHVSKADLPFKCLKCGYATTNYGGLKRHTLSRHGSKADLPFKCLLCDFAAAENGHLKIHMLSRHGSKTDLPFKCLLCGYATAIHSHLKKHTLSRHSSKTDLPYKCLKCDYTTAEHAHFKAHMLSKHCSKADLPFKCSLCDYATAYSVTFKKHMLARHGSKAELPFKCLLCEFAAAQTSDLKRHMLSRHGSKADLPFKCLLCEYAAAKNVYLKRHMLSRHGSKADLPFKCLLCSYATVNHGDLKKHTLFRHGSKADWPNKCLLCDFATVQHSNLKRHMLSRHGSTE